MTPCYTFDIDIFRRRIEAAGNALPGIPLVYSIKANPFLIPYLPDEIAHIEVCSPGELEICKKLNTPPGKIIYSGVLKEEADIEAAVSYGADILTAESLLHIDLIKKVLKRTGTRVKLLLRASSGNQFGMSFDDLKTALNEASSCENIHVPGLHYYSGTAKNCRGVEKDVIRLKEILEQLRSETGFSCEILEYGPGLAAESFASTDAECENKDMELLSSVSPILKELGRYCRLSIEMGRFLAAPCGEYETSVKDLKTTDGVTYAIVDGGTHHLKYFGPNTAMKTPLVEQDDTDSRELKDYAVCGALCTTADVITRNISLKELHIGDKLRFMRVGAYSVTEAPVLFLSRQMPEICIRSASDGTRLIREGIGSYRLNSPGL